MKTLQCTGASASLAVVAIGRNEGQRVVELLLSIEASSAGSPVIYVDSGSTDDSIHHAEIAGAVVVRLDTSIAFTAARARNAGAKKLVSKVPKTEFLQFLDGDCCLQSGWVDDAVRVLRADSQVAVVCGRRRERYPEASLYNALIDREWDTPIGETLACGGDALFRREAFEAVGGFDETIIAGEEPELCYRLRQAGWKIRRIDAEMTLHDADLHRFSQWWKRAKRYGHSAFEGAWRYGRTAERYNMKEVRGILIWGFMLPTMLAIALVIAASSTIWPLLVLLVLYVVQWLRLTRQFAGPDPISFATRRAALLMACKIAEFLGGCRFLKNRLLGQANTLIEYKGAADAADQ